MYQEGELIVYSNNGVCSIVKKGKIEINMIDSNRLYYTLSPIYKNEEYIYVPIEMESQIRPLITKEEAIAIIDQIPNIKDENNDNLNTKALMNYYNDLLKNNDCKNLVKIVKSIYNKNIEASKLGRQPGQIDSKYMKRAEDLLHGEFAIALGIPKEKVKSFIEKRIKEIL